MKTIADPALAAALRQNGIRTEAEIPELVSLCWTEYQLEARMPYSPVTSLAGLEVCTKLQHVELHGAIVDLAPIANAPVLKQLWIHLAPECSYAPLAKTTSLVKLALTGGRGDVAPLRTLYQLEALKLEDAPVDDLTPLADLPALREVTLWNLRRLDVAPGTKNREVLLGWAARGVALSHDISKELAREVTERAIARGGTSLPDRVRQLGAPAIATLIESGGTDSNGNSPLHLVAALDDAKLDKVAIVRAILDAGIVAIDAMNKEGKTALAVAASQYMSNVEIVRVLVDHGAQTDVAMPFVINPFASFFKSRDEQRAVLDVLAPRLTRPWTTDELIGLILIGEVARVDRALAKGEVQVREMGKSSQQTVLHAAAEADNLDLVRKLLAAGADPRSSTPMQSGYGTPLHRGSGVAIAALLLDAGADVNAVEVSNGETPLMTAAARKHWDKCDLLLDRGANVNALTHRRQTVLHRLAEHEAPDDERARRFYDRLLAAGIDLGAVDNAGKTAHAIAYGGFKRILTRMRKSLELPKPKRSAKPK